MRCSLLAKVRPGVSTYIEAFILIGIAAGGAGVVLEAALGYANAIPGPSVAIEDPSIRQGAYAALETLTVVDTGSGTFQWFTLETTGVPASASYCYSLYDPGNASVLSSDCPPSSSGPDPLTVGHPLPPGSALVLTVTIEGDAFTVGSSSLVTVTASDGAQGSVQVRVSPA